MTTRAKAATIAALTALLWGMIYVCVGKALAHDAPSGWKYPLACCSSLDCREVPASWAKPTATGYLMPNGQTLPYSMVKESPDGAVHWCTSGGTDDGSTICLFMPPQSY